MRTTRYLFTIFFLLVMACGEDGSECRGKNVCWTPTADGLCLDSGDGRHYCAIAFRVCPSGYQWDSTAPKSIRETCVVPELLPKDGGVDGQLSDALSGDGAVDAGAGS